MALLNDNDLMLKAIFAKYSEPSRGVSGTTTEKSYMKKGQFILMISKLSQRIKELEKIDIECIEAVFYLIAGDSILDFGEFERWWLSGSKFFYFTDQDARGKLQKAYKLYRKYATDDKVNLEGFLRLIGDLKLIGTPDDFDDLDVDDDGLLSFREFCDWLRWF